MASSGFTLSSGTTDNSRESSVLFYPKPSEEPGNNAFTVQLKKIYRGISALEMKILNEDINKGGPDQGRITLKGLAKEVTDEEAKRQKWKKFIGDHHKQ
jgi:hypothetical protein